MRTSSKKIRVALAGGGTGGHTYPLIAVMEAMQAYGSQGYDLEFHYFGGEDPFSREIIARGAEMHRLAVGKWRRYFSLLNFIDIPKIAWSFIQALFKLYVLMPDVLFSKGGPGALPAVIAAWFYRIPVLIHESDATPGITNLVSAYFAKRIGVGFDSAARYFKPKKTALTGNPVRPSLSGHPMDPATAKERLGFDPQRPLLFVIGGSQGAQRLNELVILSLKELLPLTQVLHQTGAGNYAETDKLARAAVLDIPVEVEASSRYKYMPYIGDKIDGVETLAYALSAADIVVSRAGAGSIAELAAFGKPAILIPLEGHQRENAYSFSEVGAARVIEESNLAESIFMSAVRDILNNPEKATKMAAAARSWYRSDAAVKLAEELMALAV